MSVTSALARLGAMNGEELRFRIESGTRKLIGRAHHAVAPPRWRRDAIVDLLNPSASAQVSTAREAARQGDFLAAHRALADHFSRRRSPWPVNARNRSGLIGAIQSRFPHAIGEAARHADLLVDGRHDLLGYRNVPCGRPTDWQRDPVHGARPPAWFWAQVPYLDPVFGDHKVLWELNRHQHWRALGRAFWLTGNAAYRDVFIDELETWIAANPPETGANWASMLELAFRTLSWTWAVELFSADGRDSTPWLVDLLVALDRQLAHIAHNLSVYFSPNTHLSGEALALYAVSSAFPELVSSAARADLGRRVLVRESSRQIRPDGGHAELSAHYHRYSTDFFLLALMVARSCGDSVADRFEAAVRAQAAYLRTLADDRGRLPLLGDDDGGQLFGISGERPADASSTLAAAAALLEDVTLAVAPAGEEVYWILGQAPATELTTMARSEWPSRVLPDSGYFVSRTQDGDHLIFDAGPHGFLNGGHAHSDALSIVLTVAGDPLLVDPGTATYTMDPAARDRFRSTRMHNTVVIDGRDHARPRGPFHWHERPRGHMLTAVAADRWDFAQGTHDAYGSTVHVRSVLALHRIGWIIVDQMVGSGEVTAQAWWHLHPRWRPTVDRGSVTLDGGDRQLVMAVTTDDVVARSAGEFAEFAPEYGRIESAPTLLVTQRRPAPFAMGMFIPAFITPGQETAITALPLERPLTDGWVGAAFEVHAGRTALTVFVASPRSLASRAWPGVPWGTSTVETDARLLVLRHHADQCEELAFVDGRLLRAAGLASAVHTGAGSEGEGSRRYVATKT